LAWDEPSPWHPAAGDGDGDTQNRKAAGKTREKGACCAAFARAA